MGSTFCSAKARAVTWCLEHSGCIASPTRHFGRSSGWVPLAYSQIGFRQRVRSLERIINGQREGFRARLLESLRLQSRLQLLHQRLFERWEMGSGWEMG